MLAMAVCLCQILKLTHRDRQQAGSYKSGPASKLRSMHYPGAQRQS
ncbi:hypothetical protein EMIT0P44_70113 [Pseudomonas sp. IT-P44]